MSEVIVYQMVSDLTDMVYIGSTSGGLPNRLRHHRSKFTAWKKGKAVRLGSFRILEIDPKARLIEMERCTPQFREIVENYCWSITPKTVNICEPGCFVLAGGREGYHEKLKDKYECPDCGSIIARGYRIKHEKTIKHLVSLSIPELLFVLGKK